MQEGRFETVLCDTAESRSIHYRIRYRVYCMETGFENPKAFEDGKEKDGHDKHSTHFIVRDLANGHWIAAMRLVGAGGGRMPAEEFCNLEPVPENLVTRSKMVEFSRLCVIESHRRRNRDRSLPIGIVNKQDSNKVRLTTPHPMYPEILLSFLRATADWSRENNVYYSYFLISRALARTLKRLNLEINPVGDSCEHRGIRTPYVVDLRESERRVKEKPSVFREMFVEGNTYTRYSTLTNGTAAGIPKLEQFA